MVKIKAFSLAEAMISMLIITMVGIAALPVLTKSKPPIESISLRGQYGCWYEQDADGVTRLKEWYFDERAPRTSEPIDVEAQDRGCILKLDQRPANFYMLASGAGSSDVPAQVSAVWTPAISNELAIVVGKSGTDNVNTVVSTGGMYDDPTDDTDDKVFIAGGSAEVNAAGPKEDLNDIAGGVYYNIIDANGLSNHFGGIIPENIITCKVISETTNQATSCEVLDVISHKFDASGNVYYDQSYKIRFNGCETYDASGNPDDRNLLEFSNIQFNGIKSQTSFKDVSEDIINQVSSANSFSYSGNIDCGLVNNVTVKFGLEHANSSYVAQQRLLNFERNTLADWSTSEKSKMAKMIEMISIRRQSALTERILKQNPGGIRNNGAVIILW